MTAAPPVINPGGRPLKRPKLMGGVRLGDGVQGLLMTEFLAEKRGSKIRTGSAQLGLLAMRL
jgi:hypothetical protein